jgi:hypothetical protein
MFYSLYSILLPNHSQLLVREKVVSERRRAEASDQEPAGSYKREEDGVQYAFKECFAVVNALLRSSFEGGSSFVYLCCRS